MVRSALPAFAAALLLKRAYGQSSPYCNFSIDSNSVPAFCTCSSDTHSYSLVSGTLCPWTTTPPESYIIPASTTSGQVILSTGVLSTGPALSTTHAATSTPPYPTVTSAVAGISTTHAPPASSGTGVSAGHSSGVAGQSTILPPMGTGSTIISSQAHVSAANSTVPGAGSTFIPKVSSTIVIPPANNTTMIPIGTGSTVISKASSTTIVPPVHSTTKVPTTTVLPPSSAHPPSSQPPVSNPPSSQPPVSNPPSSNPPAPTSTGLAGWLSSTVVVTATDGHTTGVIWTATSVVLTDQSGPHPTVAWGCTGPLCDPKCLVPLLCPGGSGGGGGGGFPPPNPPTTPPPPSGDNGDPSKSGKPTETGPKSTNPPSSQPASTHASTTAKPSCTGTQVPSCKISKSIFTPSGATTESTSTVTSCITITTCGPGQTTFQTSTQTGCRGFTGLPADDPNPTWDSWPEDTATGPPNLSALGLLGSTTAPHTTTGVKTTTAASSSIPPPSSNSTVSTTPPPPTSTALPPITSETVPPPTGTTKPVSVPATTSASPTQPLNTNNAACSPTTDGSPSLPSGDITGKAKPFCERIDGKPISGTDNNYNDSSLWDAHDQGTYTLSLTVSWKDGCTGDATIQKDACVDRFQHIVDDCEPKAVPSGWLLPKYGGKIMGDACVVYEAAILSG